MDLSMLPAPVSEYSRQRTGARFTVRSANSPSYSLTRRPGVRKPRGISEEERETTEEISKSERCGTYAGTNGTNKDEDSVVTGYQARIGSSVKGQSEGRETTGHKLNQNDAGGKTITEFGTDRSLSSNPASESRGRTDWRRYDLPSRSKSLDWRSGALSPDNSKMDMLSSKRDLDERRTGVEGVRGRVMFSIQAYKSAATSSVQEKGPLSHRSQTLDRASRGHSLPTRLRSLSGSVSGSVVSGTSSSFGPKGGQSITERIEKLYGSSGFGKTEDSSKNSTYERTSGGTFPRHLSSRERGSVSPLQSRNSFTWTQKDTSETLLSPGMSRTRERLSGIQWQGPIQSRYSGDGGVNWHKGFEEVGTRSLDRARSRYCVAAQIRSARDAAGITQPLQSNSFLEEGRSFSLRDSSRLRERRASGSWDYSGLKSETNRIHGTLTESNECLDEKTKETRDGAKELQSSSTDEDVFESNPQKITMNTIERKRFPERSSSSSASVRNKINQFEALSQRTQGLATGQAQMPRRAFSVPTQLSRAHDGVKKSGSAKGIGGFRDKWEGLKEGDGDTEEKGTGAGNKFGSNRSFSVDEVGLRLERKVREGSHLVENEGKESSNNCAEDADKYSKLKSTLEIPINGGQGYRKNFYIDETDFSKISSPETPSERPPSLLPSDSSDSSASVQKTSPEVTSPVSDEDKTPTNSPKNSPNNSPFLTPTKQMENVIPIADSKNESTSVPTQATKTPPKQDSPTLPCPLATSSHSNLPDLISPDVDKANRNSKKQVLDLDAWIAGLTPQVKVWDDEEDDYEDDDESTQKDEDSNYDSDSGESSVTITSNTSHRSFCVSLSDLCNFAGVDYESENDSDEWQSTSHRTASLSSDMSALSCVSVMPSEELERLLEDVRSVGDNNLQDYNDVQVVVLHKDIGVGLGFSVAGGIDQNKPVTVHRVFHSGVAAKEGSIREGDQVLSINGTALCGYAHWEALRVLRRAKTREMGVVVLRRGEISGVCKGGAQTKNQAPTQEGERLCVRLEKNSRDLGFSLEGGVDSSLGNRPLTVQKIFQGGPFDKVCPGDEVEEIEGVSVVGMRRLEAWTMIRRLPPGPVDVVLRRPLKHLET
ncbi:uncharacterized protein si:dkey-92i15.4 [Plectropomus leopardus]|uniref:uncharacterized protein si:dkey-92i15.4 n=1 Tax=Plectropomus leopardus TaxID=160734 RepID=UPI001C4BE818|nr:uncharacterized protein si:dkey-92i15.4 [Plectropomus leopardus]XP_042345426.1 uncharacterized protein si:dkey-92i15.4 [Plectropomus leopardus]